MFSPLSARSFKVNLQEAWVNIAAALPDFSASTQAACHLNIKALHLHPTHSLHIETEASYFTGSQDSRSKPLWIDCAMEDSIRSTYLTTRGAYRSWRCLWNFPLHRWSMQERGGNKQVSACCRSKRILCDIAHRLYTWTYSLSGESHWAAGRGGSCPSSRGTGSPKRHPCR